LTDPFLYFAKDQKSKSRAIFDSHCLCVAVVLNFSNLVYLKSQTYAPTIVPCLSQLAQENDKSSYGQHEIGLRSSTNHFLMLYDRQTTLSWT